MQINYGGSVAISTVDWAGKSAIVLFFRGCPLRCVYCHNHTLWEGENFVDVEHIKNQIKNSMPFVSAVVLSGGEPLAQEGIFEVAAFAKFQGLLIGVETSGYYPEVAKRLIEKGLVDKFFVDIKATQEKYEKVTKNKYAFSRLERFLKIIQFSSVPVELRTTIIKGLIGEPQELKKIVLWASECVGKDITIVIQQGLPENGFCKYDDKLSLYTRDEVFDSVKDIKHLVRDLKIRTFENGEEKV